MSRQHPVHDTVAALTRLHRMHINITPEVSYRVEAPCLLQQLAQELGVSSTGSGGRTIPSSRLLLAGDAWDLWVEIQTSVHTWADNLELDRRPYLPAPPPERPARDRPTAQAAPPPWWSLLDPEAAADVVQTIPAPTAPAPAPGREQLADPDRNHELPPAGRLLRLVAATATGRGLDNIADAIHRSTERWRAQIEQMLHGVQEQRGVRGAGCPACTAYAVTEQRDDGTYRIPAIVLVQREIAGDQLEWLACLACGWSRGAGDLLAATVTTYLTTTTTLLQQLAALLPRRRRCHPRRRATRCAACRRTRRRRERTPA